MQIPWTKHQQQQKHQQIINLHKLISTDINTTSKSISSQESRSDEQTNCHLHSQLGKKRWHGMRPCQKSLFTWNNQSAQVQPQEPVPWQGSPLGWPVAQASEQKLCPWLTTALDSCTSQEQEGHAHFERTADIRNKTANWCLQPYSIASSQQRNPHTKFIHQENDSHSNRSVVNAFKDASLSKKDDGRNDP